MDMPVIDHRGPDFGELGKNVLERLKLVFKTEQPVIMFPSSGTGAWEAALVNVLSPGDKVLMYETGQFATLWQELATRLELQPEFIAGDWRGGVDPDKVAARLEADTAHEIKAVCCVHNETSTGVTSRISAVREAIDRTGHPALFMVEAGRAFPVEEYVPLYRRYAGEVRLKRVYVEPTHMERAKSLLKDWDP